MKIHSQRCLFCKTIYKPTIGRGNYCSDHCRFWHKVEKSTSDKCWEYQASTNIDGYGKFTLNCIDIAAHRFSWQELHGKIPDGMCILHKCDNPPCVNPSHLYLGTPANNFADMVSRTYKPKILGLKGELNPSAKLTTDEVMSIKILLSYGVRLTAIARSYNRGIGTIFDIKHGRTWSHI